MKAKSSRKPVAVPVNKRVVIDIGARETEFEIERAVYRLRYGFEAIAEFETVTGINPGVDAIKPTIFNLLCLLYSGLRAHHPDITLKTVESWFTESSTPALSKLAWESYYGPLPKEEKKDGAENPPKA